MQSNYQYCIEQVLISEGGYTNDPQDPGGPTNWGITIHDVQSYLNPHATAADVKALTKAQAIQIYKDKYWNAVGGDNLPSGVDYCVFDYGVNSGVSRALKVYHDIHTKEYMSDATSADTINEICDERMSFLRGLSTFSRFGKGWTSRVTSVRAKSLQLAQVPVSSHPDLNSMNDQLNSFTSMFSTIKNFFKDNFKTNVIPLGAGATALFTKDWPYVLGGAVMLAGLVWFGFYLYERKTNVSTPS